MCSGQTRLPLGYYSGTPPCQLFSWSQKPDDQSTVSARYGKTIGGPSRGGDGVDKRLDIAATVLHFGGSVHDLAGLDLAYAPPFGSAKDPIHMAAFVAENDLAQVPGLTDYDAVLDGFQVIDVRNASELAILPLPGAVHIPVDELSERWGELDPNRPTIAVCHSGKRAHVAACLLQGQGFSQVTNLNGGMSIRQLTPRKEN